MHQKDLEKGRMRMKNFHHTGVCPVRDFLGRLGNKWSLLVLITLKANGTLRFGEIHRSLGDVSQRMLTVTLRDLEADGLVVREVFPQVPPRVEYRLSWRGESLMPHIEELVDWALRNLPDILQDRDRYTGKSCE